MSGIVDVMTQALRVVYPQKGHKTYELSTFVMGQVTSQATHKQLLIQGKPALLSKQGFFNEAVSLTPGNNYISLELKTTEGVSTQSLQIFSHQPEKICSRSSPEINLATLSLNGDIALMPGQELSLQFSASPGAIITLSVPDIGLSSIPIVAHYPEATTEADGYIDNREPIFKEQHQTKPRIPKASWYEASVKIPTNAKSVDNVSISLHIETAGKSTDIVLPISLSIWRQQRLAYIQTNNPDGAVIRISPPEGDRLTPLKSGALLWIDQKQEDWCRIRLSPQDIAWVHQDDLQWGSHNTDSAEYGILPPYVLMHDIITGTESLTLSSNVALPLHIDARVNEMETFLFGSTMSQQALEQQKSDFFTSLKVTQERENVVKIQSSLKKPCAGFDFYYLANGNTQLEFKTLPDELSQLKIVLDPGHGGNEFGSTGLSGLPEKNLNLTIAQLLKHDLVASGISNVLLTRNNDVDLSLPSRGALVREYQPHLVIILHHNALPDGRDPKKYKGACTFYYHAFAKPLAETLQSALVNKAQIPDYGVIHESFYITRIPQAISVLVELGFFTNPDEYEKLIDPEHQKKSVNALVEGIHQFFKIATQSKN